MTGVLHFITSDALHLPPTPLPNLYACWHHQFTAKERPKRNFGYKFILHEWTNIEMCDGISCPFDNTV